MKSKNEDIFLFRGEWLIEFFGYERITYFRNLTMMKGVGEFGTKFMINFSIFQNYFLAVTNKYLY